MGRKRTPTELVPTRPDEAYSTVLADVIQLLESARRAAARSVNSIMAATYWAVGRRIVEEEQRGRARAAYGERLIERLAQDLTTRFGRGFSKVNLKQMRKFYREWSIPEIGQTPSDQFTGDTRPPAETSRMQFRLSWSHYVRLLSVEKPQARAFYETEALRGGWTVRELGRQIGTRAAPHEPPTPTDGEHLHFTHSSVKLPPPGFEAVEDGAPTCECRGVESHRR